MRWCTSSTSTPCWPGCRDARTRCWTKRRRRASTCGASTPTTWRWPATKRLPGRTSMRFWTPSELLRRAGRRQDPYPQLGVPDASRVHAVPHRNVDDALPAHAGGQGYRLGPQHDSARLVHDEAERRGRDGIDHLARVRASASVRPGLRRARAAPAHRRLGELAGGHHRLRRGLAAAQRQLTRRVRRPAGDPRLPREPGRAAPRHLPHPIQRTRHQRSVGRAGRAAGGRGGLPRPTRRRRRPRRPAGQGGRACRPAWRR